MKNIYLMESVVADITYDELKACCIPTINETSSIKQLKESCPLILDEQTRLCCDIQDNNCFQIKGDKHKISLLLNDPDIEFTTRFYQVAIGINWEAVAFNLRLKNIPDYLAQQICTDCDLEEALRLLGID